MFYKIKGISPRTGKGTVSILYRQHDFESLFSTGVTIRPEDFNTKTGQVKSRVPEHPELNAQIQKKVTEIETAVRDVKERNWGRVSKYFLNKELEDTAKFEALMREGAERFKENRAEVVVGIEAKIEAKTRKFNEKIAKERQQIAEGNEFIAHWSNGDYEAYQKSTKTLTLAAQIADYIKLSPEYRRTKTLEEYQDMLDKFQDFGPGFTLSDVNLKVFQEFQSYLVEADLRHPIILRNYSGAQCCRFSQGNRND